MAKRAGWVDLLDPDEAEIRRHSPVTLLASALAQLLRPASPRGDVRPTLQSHDSYVFGVLLVAVAVPEEDRVFYQEVDLVLTDTRLVTVRKSAPGSPPFDLAPVREICSMKDETATGMIAFHLVDDIAERYLDVLDDLNGEIGELEDQVESWPLDRGHRRLSELRTDLLHIRRTLAPTREAVRGVVDGRVDLKRRPIFRREAFPREVEREFVNAYEKLLRASEGLELSRDLLAGVRDYHQSRVASDQNEVVKRLTAIASLLLFPTFWVGVYGQNFDNIPEFGWRLGYLWSWGVIVVVTIAQLIVFRRKRWL